MSSTAGFTGAAPRTDQYAPPTCRHSSLTCWPGRSTPTRAGSARAATAKTPGAPGEATYFSAPGTRTTAGRTTPRGSHGPPLTAGIRSGKDVTATRLRLCLLTPERRGRACRCLHGRPQSPGNHIRRRPAGGYPGSPVKTAPGGVLSAHAPSSFGKTGRSSGTRPVVTGAPGRGQHQRNRRPSQAGYRSAPASPRTGYATGTRPG
jgi:hypothetical protein